MQYAIIIDQNYGTTVFELQYGSLFFKGFNLALFQMVQSIPCFPHNTNINTYVQR